LKSITNLIKGFFERAGSYVFLATVIARLFSFIAHIIVLQIIPSERLGVVIYAFSFISFLIPIGGFGVQQSLLRYGSLLKTKAEKDQLFVYTLKKGILFSLFIVVIIIMFKGLIPFKFEQASFYFMMLSLAILSQFLLSLMRIQFRLQHKNKQYAFVEISYTLLFLISVSILSYLYQEVGYICAIIFTPILIFAVFFKSLNVKITAVKKLNIIDSAFWKYGFFASLSYVATLLLFEIDTILIGNLLNNTNEITYYKYISLIPFSLLFLPRVLLTTDFVNLTEHISDRLYIKNYIKSYLSIFVVISFFLLLLSFLFSNAILQFFGPEYTNYKSTFLTLMFGITGILLARGLFGNLLSVIGKANLNFNIAIIAIVINVISNYYFIPKYGILGAAITSAVIMWFTGILSVILFFYKYKNLK
jgi:O-antigen/teichoic acid export membrane protein